MIRGVFIPPAVIGPAVDSSSMNDAVGLFIFLNGLTRFSKVCTNIAHFGLVEVFLVVEGRRLSSWGFSTLLPFPRAVVLIHGASPLLTRKYAQVSTSQTPRSGNFYRHC